MKFKCCEPTKKEAVEFLEDHNRCTITPEGAKQILSAFGLKINDKLIRTTNTQREISFNDGSQRVNISDIAEDILKQKKIHDKADFTISNQMIGVGSGHSEKTKACCNVIRKELMDLEHGSL